MKYMSIEHEGKITSQGEPKRKSLPSPSSLIRSVLERIPFTDQSMDRMMKRFLAEKERVIEEVVMPDFDEKGLLGKHQLIALPNIQRGVFGNVEGDLRGGFFLVIGSMEGHIKGGIRTCSSVQFAWRPEGQTGVVISEIPIDKFVLEEGKEEIPMVEFDLNPNDYLNDPKVLKRVILTIDGQTRKLLPFPSSN